MLPVRGVLSISVSHAQGVRGAPPPALQLPQCAVQVAGFNNGATDVRVTSVQVVEAGQTSGLMVAGGAFTLATGGVKVVRMASRLAKCGEGRAEVTLELQSNPKRTHVFKTALTPERTSVELGDVKRFF